jgi:hypothetical protein
VCAINPNEDEMFVPSPGQCVASAIVTGALIGLLIGELSRTDVWAPVRLPTTGPSEPRTSPVTLAAETDGGVAQ